MHVISGNSCMSRPSISIAQYDFCQLHSLIASITILMVSTVMPLLITDAIYWEPYQACFRHHIASLIYYIIFIHHKKISTQNIHFIELYIALKSLTFLIRSKIENKSIFTWKFMVTDSYAKLKFSNWIYRLFIIS